MKEKFHQFEKCFRIYQCVEYLFFGHIINLFGSLILSDIGVQIINNWMFAEAQKKYSKMIKIVRAYTIIWCWC